MADTAGYGKARDRYLGVLGNSVREALVGRGFVAYHTETAEQALETVLSIIPAGATVGVPGSVTIREIGAIEALEKKGCRVFQHWEPALSAQEKTEILRRENGADFFLTSSNAITRTGILVNVDGVGNRVAGMAWGTGEVVFVVSMNKVVENLEAAMDFVRNRSCPMSAMRRGVDSPCSRTGYCVRCGGDKKICKAFLILENPTTGRRVHVVLVNETLGC